MVSSGHLRVVLLFVALLTVSFPQFAAAQGDGVPQRLAALEAVVKQLQAELAAETAARMAADRALQNAINALATGFMAGILNFTQQDGTSVAGGYLNVAGRIDPTDGAFSSISGGSRNTASGAFSTVSGGEFNSASGPFSAVSGGIDNVASGHSATVSGGTLNAAAGSGDHAP